MGKDFMGYDELVDDAVRGAMVSALRGVMVAALQRVAERGLPGDHHFYISFHTHHAGVEIGADLKKLYPNDLTIVIQHQFWNLVVGDQSFSVTLSFNGVRQPLKIPFAAVTAFADPSAKFGLQFGPSDASVVGAGKGAQAGRPAEVEEETPLTGGYAEVSGVNTDDKVVALDTFRKK